MGISLERHVVVVRCRGIDDADHAVLAVAARGAVVPDGGSGGDVDGVCHVLLYRQLHFPSPLLSFPLPQ